MRGRDRTREERASPLPWSDLSSFQSFFRRGDHERTIHRLGLPLSPEARRDRSTVPSRCKEGCPAKRRKEEDDGEKRSAKKADAVATRRLFPFDILGALCS